MALAKRFLPYSALINCVALSSTWINQIKTTTPNAGVKLFEETSGSQIDREFVAAKDIMPKVDLVTTDLTVLESIGFGGLHIAPAENKPGIQIFGRLLPLGSVPAPIASDDHLVLSISDGMIVPKSIRATHNSVATLNLDLRAILGTTATYSGATPFVYQTAQAIPSGAGGTSNIYTTGPIDFTDGSETRLLQGITEINVDFGIELIVESDSGDVYPSIVAMIARMSKIEFKTKDVEFIEEIGDGDSVTAFSAYFRQVDEDGQRVDPGTATHVAISATAGMITPGSVNLKYKESGEEDFTFTPQLDTNLLTISTTSEIPTS